MWDDCGMTRSEASLRHALGKIPELREEFRTNVRVLGTDGELNQSLEKAGRVADFLELAELMCIDALDRTESCGGHFRVESQTPEGEARRDDEQLLLRRGLGVERRGPGADSAQGAADIRVRAPDAAELQVIMNLTLKIWRQKDTNTAGQLVTYQVKGVTADMSFLEMLDVLNEELIGRGEEPVAFDHDCREGICGSCGFLINGVAHGPRRGTTVCQLHMRFFKDGDSLTLEPWRAKAFPVVKDLVVDRSAFDRIIQAGGYISAPTGSAPDANAILVPKEAAETAMDAAACIGCGACVAACPNASAMLFTAAKITHLNVLPQGQPERDERTLNMVAAMDREEFGSCTNHGECEAVCPKEIPLEFIAELNRDLLRATLRPRRHALPVRGATLPPRQE